MPSRPRTGKTAHHPDGLGLVAPTLPVDPDSDERIVWMKKCVENGLMLEFTRTKEVSATASSYPMPPDGGPPSDIWRDCLERDGRRNLQILMNFLDASASSGPPRKGADVASAVIFWAEVVSRRVELTANAEEKSVNDDDGDLIRGESIKLLPDQGEEEVKDTPFPAATVENEPAAPQGDAATMDDANVVANELKPADNATGSVPALNTNESAAENDERFAIDQVEQQDIPSREDELQSLSPPTPQFVTQEFYRLNLATQELPDNIF
ncbi:hypothetical protein HK405_008414 [Cladochytrium tenue]|nr:hypothetical protein HK405_008414 [Cladochytrium tenue]